MAFRDFDNEITKEVITKESIRKNLVKSLFIDIAFTSFYLLLVIVLIVFCVYFYFNADILNYWFMLAITVPVLFLFWIFFGAFVRQIKYILLAGSNKFEIYEEELILKEINYEYINKYASQIGIYFKYYSRLRLHFKNFGQYALRGLSNTVSKKEYESYQCAREGNIFYIVVLENKNIFAVYNKSLFELQEQV